jgi:hypothetical protein
VGIEFGYQSLAFGLGSAKRYGSAMLQLEQAEHLRQRAAGGSKLAVLPTTSSTSIPRQRGFVHLRDVQPMLAKPSAKLICHADVPSDRLWWVPFVVQSFGE